jgi:hypothetical protein
MDEEGEVGEAPRVTVTFHDATQAVAAAVRALRRPTIVVVYVVVVHAAGGAAGGAAAARSITVNPKP